MADPQPTQQPPQPSNLPPAVGRSLSVRILDEGMYDDLAVIMRSGCDASAAVRRALLLLANAYHGAWQQGHYPPGVAPEIAAATLTPYQPRPTG